MYKLLKKMLFFLSVEPYSKWRAKTVIKQTVDVFK